MQVNCMSTATIEQRLTEIWETPKTVWGWFATVDHKTIGFRYLVTAMVLLCIGGIEALIMRIQLSRPDQAILSPEMYNQLFTHAWHHHDLLVCLADPFRVFELSDSADDRCARHGLSASQCVQLLVISSFGRVSVYIAPCMGQAPHAGWFAYVPYTRHPFTRPAVEWISMRSRLIFLTISTTAGAINFIMTILRLRAPGMAISKMPLLCYSTGTISCAIFSLCRH